MNGISTELVRNTLTSLEVAEMMEVGHDKLIRKLEGDSKQVGIISVLRNTEIGVSEYFIESTYKTDGNNKTYKCYEITKKGCEMIAHKMTGEKGILFTAKYIERFHQMEDYIKSERGQIGVEKYSQQVEKAKCEMSLMEVTANVLGLNSNSKLLLATKIYEENGISTNQLPAYTDSKGVLKSATELLKQFAPGVSVIKFNKMLIDKGILEEKERKSTKNPAKIKKYKRLINTYYGENQISPKNPSETQPLYYEDKFKELLKKLNIEKKESV